jgi:hydroxymethylbilane synthase
MTTRSPARPLRIGTRSSALALAQAGTVAEAIGVARPVELVRSTDRPTGGLDDKSRWVSGIEQALLAGEIDLAVHSAKDLPVDLPDGLAVIGAPTRADARDVLCGADSLAGLAAGARVGTSSLRRMAQILAARPDLDVRECHGNVDTRLRKLAAGDYEAIVLAAAGLDRLGLAGGSPLEELVPAAGQGTLALEARVGDAEALAAIEGLRDRRAELELSAERAVVGTLGAGCNTPLGIHAVWAEGRLVLRAFVGMPDGSVWIRDELSGAVGDEDAGAGGSPGEGGSTRADGTVRAGGSPGADGTVGANGSGRASGRGPASEEAEALGRELAERLLSAGAGAMLG